MEKSWRKKGRQKVVLFNYIPEYDWIVASSGYLDEFYSVLATINRIGIVSIVVMLFLVLLTSFWLSKWMIHPLETLIDRLSIGKTGRLNQRIPVEATDEIGRLSMYFNAFMDELETNENHLKTEISDHKHTAAALRESEQKYKTILRCINEGYFEVDLQGNFKYLNQSMTSLSGYSNRDLLNKNIFQLVSTENTKKLSRLFGNRGGGFINGEIFDLELIKKDGSTCFVETSLYVMLDKKNRQSGFRGVMRNVTQKIEDRKALLLSEEMFSKAFKSSPSGMFLADIETIQLNNVNESFLRFTGYELDAVLGRTLEELCFFNNLKEGRKQLKLLKARKNLRNQEMEFCKQTGEIRHGMISAEIVEIAGKNVILAAFEDYTEVKKLEREVLEMSERERRKIAFALHDDLCPQLIGIDVLFDILKQRLQTELPAAVDSADKIGGQLRESIQKARLLSRGLFPVDIVKHGFDVSLSELVEYVEDTFGIACQLDCDNFNPFTDNTTASHAYYIAHEAIHNAVKHAGAEKIRVQFTTSKGKSILAVRDDGKGLCQEKQRKGMGMKIMQYRARRVNGSLEMGTSPEGGTVVLLEMRHNLS